MMLAKYNSRLSTSSNRLATSGVRSAWRMAAEYLWTIAAGSGKTLGYLLPIMLALCRRRAKHSGRARRAVGPRAVVLSPTRELAAQVRRLSAHHDWIHRFFRAWPAWFERVSSSNLMAWCVDLQIARVVDAILPGTGLHVSLLTKASAAGTDFAKACARRSRSSGLCCSVRLSLPL